MPETSVALDERYTSVANDLAAWINAQPIEKDTEGNPTISPVYGGWALLCSLIEERAKMLDEIHALRQQIELVKQHI